MKKTLFALGGLASVVLASAPLFYQNLDHSETAEVPAVVQEVSLERENCSKYEKSEVKQQKYSAQLPAELSIEQKFLQSSKNNKIEGKLEEQDFESDSLEEKIANLVGNVEILYNQFRGIEPDYTETRERKSSGMIAFGDKKAKYEANSASLGIYLPAKNGEEIVLGVNFSICKKEHFINGLYISDEKGSWIRICPSFDDIGNVTKKPNYTAYETDQIIFGNVKNDKKIKLSELEQAILNSFAYLIVENLKICNQEMFNNNLFQ